MEIDFNKLGASLIELSKDYNWQTRVLKLREELANYEITVACVGKDNLGRCYNAEYFEVHSKQSLPDSFISILREVGLLGYGQEFSSKSSMENGEFILVATSKCDSSD